MASKAYVDSAISSVMPEFVDSVDQMTDTNKKYVLSETGTIWVYGNTVVPPKNLFDPSAALLNMRLSGNSTASWNGMFVTNYIPVENLTANEDKFYFDKMSVDYLDTNQASGGQYIAYYDSNKTFLIREAFFTNVSASNLLYERLGSGSFCAYPLTSTTNSASAVGATYVRFALATSKSASSATGGTVITVDDIKDVKIYLNNKDGSTEQAWYDTGMAWSAGGGSGDTTDLMVQVNENAAAIVELENSVKDLSSGSNVVTIPTYWQSSMDNVISKVKTLQDAGGADVVNFCWFSDLHYVPTSKYVENVGKLCAYAMNKCDIPFTMFTGDTVTASGLPSEETMFEHIRAAGDMLSPIGNENLLWMRGNHDDVWGTYDNGSTTVHFVNKSSKQKMFNVMHREQTKDFRRVYGDHGTYFYIDNTPQKVRFICLNSQFYDGGDITATTGQMTSGFGTDQLYWLEHHALQVDDDWSVIIGFHIPPTAKSINGNTYYLGQLSDGNDFRNLMNKTDTNVIGIFCGHCHADAIVTGDLPCPIVTITSAINTPYDSEWSTRVQGTDTETAIDIVSINKSERKIYCTRLGYGSDRNTSY